MNEDILIKQQHKRCREKEAANFLLFLDRYSALLKLARSNGLIGEDCYRVVEMFLRIDSAE